jgi:hypothetical protein
MSFLARFVGRLGATSAIMLGEALNYSIFKSKTNFIILIK